MPSLESSRRKAVDDKIQAHRVGTDEYIVYNIKRGTQYNVIRNKAGVWTCTCPFNTKGSRLREGNCKHIVRVLDKENGCGLCGRKDKHADLRRIRVDEPFLCAVCRQDVRMIVGSDG